MLRGKFLYQFHREQFDIPSAFPEWQDAERHDVEAIIEILAKTAFLHSGQKIGVSSGDDPHIRLSRGGIPYGLIFTGFEKT